TSRGGLITMHDRNPISMPSTTTSTARPGVSVYVFRLILSGDFELIEEIADKLFEAGCDDGLFGTSAGVPNISFTREAASLNEAITSAIEDVRRADVGLEVVGVESEGAATVAEQVVIGTIIDRLNSERRGGRSQERGPGDDSGRHRQD